jgi:hypothetical protein
MGKIYALIVTNKESGSILGVVFANSSDHPAQPFTRETLLGADFMKLPNLRLKITLLRTTFNIKIGHIAVSRVCTYNGYGKYS